MKCNDCIHDGQCDGLPCCSNSFETRWDNCSICGREIDLLNCESDEEGNPICFECSDSLEFLNLLNQKK